MKVPLAKNWEVKAPFGDVEQSVQLPFLAHSGQFHPSVLPLAFIGSYVAFESSAGAGLSAILAQQTRRAYTVWAYLLSNA